MSALAQLQNELESKISRARNPEGRSDSLSPDRILELEAQIDALRMIRAENTTLRKAMHDKRQTEEQAVAEIELDHIKRTTILDFLSGFFYIYPNLNDTFNYATADTERISLDIEKPYGECGWCGKPKEGHPAPDASCPTCGGIVTAKTPGGEPGVLTPCKDSFHECAGWRPSNGEVLVDMFMRHGYGGIVAYVAKMRGRLPIEPLRTPEFYAAFADLEGFTYEPD